jgi:hypothetical protein
VKWYLLYPSLLIANKTRFIHIEEEIMKGI